MYEECLRLGKIKRLEEDKAREKIEVELKRAKVNHKDAKLLLEHGLWKWAVVAGYYAVKHAALAGLARVKLTADEECIEPALEKKLGSEFSKLYREARDKLAEVTDATHTTQIVSAENFLFKVVIPFIKKIEKIL